MLHATSICIHVVFLTTRQCMLAMTTGNSGNSMTRMCASDSESHLQVSYRLWACKTDEPLFI